MEMRWRVVWSLDLMESSFAVVSRRVRVCAMGAWNSLGTPRTSRCSSQTTRIRPPCGLQEDTVTRFGCAHWTEENASRTFERLIERSRVKQIARRPVRPGCIRACAGKRVACRRSGHLFSLIGSCHWPGNSPIACSRTRTMLFNASQRGGRRRRGTTKGSRREKTTGSSPCPVSAYISRYLPVLRASYHSAHLGPTRPQLILFNHTPGLPVAYMKSPASSCPLCYTQLHRTHVQVTEHTMGV